MKTKEELRKLILEKTKVVRSAIADGKDTTEEFEALDSLEKELADVEARDAHLAKLDDLEERAKKAKETPKKDEKEPEAKKPEEEKRFSPRPESGVHPVNPADSQIEEQRCALSAYVRNRNIGEIRDAGMTTVDESPIVPKDIIYTPKKELATITDLRKYFPTTQVTTGSGQFPILENPNTALVSEEELAQNPQLANPTFRSVDFKVQTYRGVVPVSNELIQDANFDVMALVANYLQTYVTMTSNEYLVKAIKTLEAVTATPKESLVDVIKKIVNVKLDPIFTPIIVCSQSLYNTLDTLKDKNGQYIFHSNTPTASNKTLLGIPVIKVADTLIGEKAGDQVAFIGDPRAVQYFDRNQVSIRWTDNPIYGQQLGVAMRFDTKVVYPQAGFVLTVTDSPAPKPKEALV